MKERRYSARQLYWLVATVSMALAVSLIASACAAAPAAQYPERPIDVIVTFAAGGASDQTARITTEFLSAQWGQAINVVNMPGGSGVVGVQAAMSAPADGYTVLLHSFANTAIPAIQSDAPYAWDDPTPFGLIAISPLVFSVPADSPWQTLEDAIEAMKADPASIQYGVGGAASPSVFGIAKLLDAAGVDVGRLNKVVFDGGAPTVAATAGGHVAFSAQTAAEVRALIEAGRLRPLAVSSSERFPTFPDVPTGAELGYPEFDVVTWNGFSGPPDTPANVQEVWAAGLEEAANNAEVQSKFENSNMVVNYRDPAAFMAFWEDQYTTFRAIAEEQGLRK